MNAETDVLPDGRVDHRTHERDTDWSGWGWTCLTCGTEDEAVDWTIPHGADGHPIPENWRDLPAVEVAALCGLTEPRCRSRWSGDHEFESRHTPKPATDVPRVVAALRDEVAPIAPTPEPSGLDALAARRPELIEARNRIAGNCPGLKAPAEREEVA